MFSNIKIDVSRLYPAIYERRSRRSYKPKPIEPKLLNEISTFCEEFRPFSESRAILVPHQVDKAFRGIIGPRGAPAFIAFVGHTGNYHIQEKIGYTGEAVILEATSLKLSTCWVGGFLRRGMLETLVDTNNSERVFAITAIGYAKETESLRERVMTGFGWTHRRKPLSSLVTGLPEEDWRDWTRCALEAARIAPSATNRQPWKFYVDRDSITISVKETGFAFNLSKRLDCGIAMLHIEIAALNQGVCGDWELLEAPQVARFTVSSNNS